MRDGPKNITIILADSLRHDCISCVEDKRFLQEHGLDQLLRTPTIDGLAENGVRFKQAIATASYTPVSLASILTGTYPTRHKVKGFFSTKLNSCVPTIAQILKRYGYTSFYGYDLPFVFEGLGLTRGADYCVPHDTGRLLNLLNEHKEEKTFLFAHFMDTHVPYLHSFHEIYPGYNDDFYSEIKRLAKYFECEEEIEDILCNEKDLNKFIMRIFFALNVKMWKMGHKSEIVRQYVRAINKFDNMKLRWFLKSLEQLDIIRDSVIVILADHGEGESFPYGGEESNSSCFAHGWSVKESLIRVPLIINSPLYLPKAKVIDDQISLIDIMPTLLDMIGIRESIDAIQGKSLLPLIFNNGGRAPEAFGEWWAEEEIVQKDVENDDSVPCYQCFLRQRFWRSPKYKYVIQGDYVSKIANQNNDLVKFICSQMLLKPVKSLGSNKINTRLKTLGEEKTTIFQIIREQLKNKRQNHLLFDLFEDSDEEHNLLTNNDDCGLLAIACEAQNNIERIADDQTYGKEESVVYSKEELNVVTDQLKVLGYL